MFLSMQSWPTRGIYGTREFTIRLFAWTKPISLWKMTQGAHKLETQLSLCLLTKFPQFPPQTFLQDGVVRSSTTWFLFCVPLFAFHITGSFAYGGSLEPRKHGHSPWEIQFYALHSGPSMYMLTQLVSCTYEDKKLFTLLNILCFCPIFFPKFSKFLFCKLCLLELSVSQNKIFLINAQE